MQWSWSDSKAESGCVWGGSERERLPSIQAGVKPIGMSVKSNHENLR